LILDEKYQPAVTVKTEKWGVNQANQASFDHNRANTVFEIRLDIFNLKGELLKTIITEEYSSGFRSNPIRWDGTNDNGSTNDEGMYLYRIKVKNTEGEEAENTGKLLLLN